MADRRVLDQPLVALAEYWKWVDSHERRDGVIDLMRRAEELGDESALPWLLFLLADVERSRQPRDRARARPGGQEAAEQAGQRLFARHNVALEGLGLRAAGSSRAARQAAHRALEATDDNYAGRRRAEALGQLELALGAPEAVVAHLEPILAFARAEAIAEPGATRFTVDLIEALVELGRRDEAVEILDWYEGNARRLERTSALANCRRCRGLLEAQAGELGAAVAEYEAALAWHDRVGIPLDHARTLLALGAVQRRTKRRRDARATLEHALAIFERSGAALWAERARGELGDQRARGDDRRAHPRRGTGRGPRRRGRDESARSRSTLRSDMIVEGPTFAHLRKARHPPLPTELARGAGAPPCQTQGIVESNTGDLPVSARSWSLRSLEAKVVLRANPSSEGGSDDPETLVHHRHRRRRARARSSRVRRTPGAPSGIQATVRVSPDLVDRADAVRQQELSSMLDAREPSFAAQGATRGTVMPDPIRDDRFRLDPATIHTSAATVTSAR